MNLVVCTYDYGTSKNEVFFISTHDQLIRYLEMQQELVADDVSQLIRTAMPYDRWDHFTPTCSRAIHGMALMKIMGGTAPLFAHNQAMTAMAKILFTAWDKLADGQRLLINKNGGYMYGSADRISDIKIYKVAPLEFLFITPNSKYLVLENDPVLDEWIVKNVTRKYSYITNLRKVSDEAFKDALTKFKMQVPSDSRATLLVYTTGLDKLQMYAYVIRCIENGINNFIFIQSMSGNESVFNELKGYIEVRHGVCDIFTSDSFR